MNALSSWKALLIIIGLFVLVAALNVIVQRLAPVRLDATDGNAFTLSEGTRNILEKAKESGRPVTIRLYVSGEDARIPQGFDDYARRVEALLDEYHKASGNSIVIERYAPTPNSVAEEAAQLDGIPERDPRLDEPAPDSIDEIDYKRKASARLPYYFGLSVSSLQNIETIPFLDPENETNLEYQLSRAIASVVRKKRLRIGLLEGNEMALAGQPAFMGGRGSPPWTIYRYLEKDFEMVPVPFDVQPMKPGDKTHPFFDLDLLMVVHPVKVNRPQSPQPGMPPMGNVTVEGLSKESQYAIDQFLVNGGKVLAFLDNQYMVSRYFDPYSTIPPIEPNPNNPPWVKDLLDLFDSKRFPNYRSGLDELYGAWGVKVGGPGTRNPVLFDPKNTQALDYQRNPQGMLQREFELMNLIRRMHPQDANNIVSAIAIGSALMADFSEGSLTRDHPVTRNLSSVRMVDPGIIEGKPINGLKMRTLVRGSGGSKAISGNDVSYIFSRTGTPAAAMAALESTPAPTDSFPVAVILEGPFTSAFETDPTLPPPSEIPEAPPAPLDASKPPIPGIPAGPGVSTIPAAPETAPTPPTTEPEVPATPPPPAEIPPAPPVPEELGGPKPEPAPIEDGPAEEGEPEEGSEGTGCQDEPVVPEPTAEPEEEAAPGSEPAPADSAGEANETPPTTDPASSTPVTPAPPESEEPKTEEEKAPESHHLKKGKEVGKLALVADVDMIFDFFLGDPNQRMQRRDHDNLAFVQNLIENLAGDQDLISIRGRRSNSRPFKVISEIRERANARQAPRQKEIQEKLIDIETNRRNALVITQTEEGGLQLGMDAERMETADRLEAEKKDLEQEQRLIRREANQEIEAAISSFKWKNMLITPLLVILLGFAVGVARKIKTAAK